MKNIRTAIISIVLVLCLLVPHCVFAEEAPLNTVKVIFAKSDIPTIAEGSVVMNLYSEDGSALLDSKTYDVKRGYEAFEIVFNVPEYSAGAKFKLAVSGAVNGIKYNGTSAMEHILETSSAVGEDGAVIPSAPFQMELVHTWNKEAVISIPGESSTLFYHCLTEKDVFVTTDMFAALGIVCETQLDAEKPTFILKSEDGSHIAQLYINDVYATFGGVGENLAAPCFEINGLPYAPLSRIAEYFACDYQVTEENEYCRKISLMGSKYSKKYEKLTYVNGIDLSSKTDYLVWVDKSDYAVNVYLGSNKNWRLIKSFPCAIGAPGSPTIEGTFEYYQYQDRWQYSGYYCGPIMRFKGGYALHSVLIRNNGTFYDGRVKAKISHGCVRMLPQDIQWMVDFVPLYTTIHVTA